MLCIFKILGEPRHPRADAGEKECLEAEGQCRLCASEPAAGVGGDGHRAARRPRAEALLRRQLERQERIHPLPSTVKVGYCDNQIL